MRQLLAAAFLIFGSTSTTGGAWQEAYQAGKYEEAAALLHPLVLETTHREDPDATAALAALYLEGKGVAQDPVIACSFAVLSSFDAIRQHGTELHPVVMGIRGFEARACGSLSDEDRQLATQRVGCPKYGPDRQTFSLTADHSVEISRRGLRTEYGGEEFETEVYSLGCVQRAALWRYTRVEPREPAPEAPLRHFIELYSWTAGVPGSGQQVLHGQLFEVIGGTVESRTGEDLGQFAGAPWNPTEVPAELASVTLESGADGAVRWRFNSAPLHGELEPSPEMPTADLAPELPSEGSAQVDVTVLDGTGAAVPGATVTLTGMVSREAVTTETGIAVLENLPDGRYDVVASADGLARSVARVLDLSGPAVSAVQFTLKPYGPMMGVGLACGGGPDPRSIRSLSEFADVVVQVKVMEQETVERPATDSTAFNDVRTLNRMQLVQSFKSPLGAKALSPSLVVLQAGGRIDRGDYIDQHSVNGFDPLNVGDEYVLFLKADTDGALWVSGFHEGAFRIRNGRVEPLGDGGAARAWKDRDARAFFDALHTTITRLNHGRQSSTRRD